MQCPECGAQLPAAPMKVAGAANSSLDSMVKKATATGGKLKSLGKKRPEIDKGGITRGGRYTKD